MHNWQADFPFHQHHPQLVYLDSAATCQQPQAVIDAMQHYVIHQHANAHRGAHGRARAATEAYELARQRVATFIGANPTNLAFTASTTAALNQLTAAAINWQPGDEIVISATEHHANLLPWQRLAERFSLSLKVIPVSFNTGQLIEPEAYLGPRTRILALTLASNVTGVVNELADLCRQARAKNILTFVDAAQAAAHVTIDVAQLGCDALAFSAHKVYGPTGIAALYMRPELWQNMPPQNLGGGIVDTVTFTGAELLNSIQKFEAGTPNVSAAVGFSAALDWLEQAHQAGAGRYLRNLHQRLLAALQQRPQLELLPTDPNGTPIVSFYSHAFHCHDLALLLGEQDIAVRAGHHCAQPLLQHWQIPGVVRLSLGLTVTEEQLTRTLVALDKAMALLDDTGPLDEQNPT